MYAPFDLHFAAIVITESAYLNSLAQRTISASQKKRQPRRRQLTWSSMNPQRAKSEQLAPPQAAYLVQHEPSASEKRAVGPTAGGYSFSNSAARGSWLFSLASSRIISRLRSSFKCGTVTSTVTIW